MLASIMRDWDDPRCGLGFTFGRCWWGISKGSIVSVGSIVRRDTGETYEELRISVLLATETA